MDRDVLTKIGLSDIVGNVGRQCFGEGLTLSKEDYKSVYLLL